MAVTALGMIETIGLVSAIEAADAGLKAADVRLLGTDYVRGGLVMVRFEGEVAAVQAAVDAGAGSARRVGKVFSAHVIPRAMPEVFCMLASDVNEGPAKLHSGGCSQCGGCEGGRREMEAMRKWEIEHADAEHGAPNRGVAEHGSGRSTEYADAEHRAPNSTVAEHGNERSTEHANAEYAPSPANASAYQDARPITPARRKRSTSANKSLAPAPNSGYTSLQPQQTRSTQQTQQTPESTPSAAPLSLPDPAQWPTMKVVALRQLARRLPDFAMTANEIRYASKQQLLDALEGWRISREHQ